MARLYGYFSSAFGTLMLVAILVGTVMHARIEPGLVGFFGFLAFLYARIRTVTSQNEPDPLVELKRQILKDAERYRNHEMQKKWLRKFPELSEPPANPTSTDIKPLS